MVVVAVYEDDLIIAFAQFVGQFQTAETAADDDHSLFVGLGNVETHN